MLSEKVQYPTFIKTHFFPMKKTAKEKYVFCPEPAQHMATLGAAVNPLFASCAAVDGVLSIFNVGTKPCETLTVFLQKHLILKLK